MLCILDEPGASDEVDVALFEEMRYFYGGELLRRRMAPWIEGDFQGIDETV